MDNEKTPAERLEAIDKITLLQGQKHNLDAVKLQSCVKAQNEDAVRASMKQADELGINGTPALFVNGQKIDGAVPPSEVRAALDAALRDAGQPVPQHAPRPQHLHPGDCGPGHTARRQTDFECRGSQEKRP